ncbi:hypothetical protein [Kaistia adipata]|uniref:bestrophin-like domain n=1 Tax=Kaistia adipata TaxID=166954 RepID=UPI0004001420|nr:hypothetical protein [Kaistia adipata]
MEFLVSVATISVFLLGALLFVAQLASHEIGFRLGLWRRRVDGQAETVGIVVGGMLGLLAFVLALTLTFANTRYSERRQGTLTEANAIGTAWLRAKAIGTARGDEIARLLVDYTALRRAFILAEHGSGEISEINDRTSAMQSEIWGHLSAVVRDQPGPISATLMTSLNDVFDAATAERFAFQMRLPSQIVWLLLLITLLSMGCLGYQLGLKRKPARLLIGLLSVMWTTVIVDILDLSASRAGNFRTDTVIYDWTAQGFEGGVTVPPLPGGP